MNRIDKKFKALHRDKKKAFLAFITAGDPSLAASYNLSLALEASGIDVLELGVPFSDPLADGPTIQAASQRALKKRINVNQVFSLVKKIRRKSEIPIALLTYYNIIYHYGVTRFIKNAKDSGVDGAIIPDLPVEEAEELVREGRKHKFSTIFLLAPTSDRKRTKHIATRSTGFIYYVSLTGTTGVRRKLPRELIKKVQEIKRITQKPVCVGFGISSKEQARAVARVADGVIVGSALIKVIEKNLGKKGLVSQVARVASRLRAAI